MLTLFCAFVTPAAASESDEGADEAPIQACINSRAIRSADVLNDSFVVFRMIGGEFFLNQLPKTCRGLSRDRRFTWEIRERRLCANDRIRVLMSAGASMIEGRSCKLGEFRRLSPDEVEYLFSPDPKPPDPEPVEPAEIEELDVDAGEKRG